MNYLVALILSAGLVVGCAGLLIYCRWSDLP
jgi:hypothetical protein